MRAVAGLRLNLHVGVAAIAHCYEINADAGDEYRGNAGGCA